MRCRTVLFGVIFLAELSSWAAAQTCETFNDCADQDGDLIRDDNCVWWDCVEGQCVSVDIHFGDMGDNQWACPPNGAADGADALFHALPCFTNKGANGGGTYPCELNPPQAMRADAGGRFGACEPDGVCDIHDNHHALNAFVEQSSCTTCPLDAGASTPPTDSRSVPSVRVFMSADGQQAVMPETGNTLMLMDPGAVAKVIVWMDLGNSAGSLLDSYQLIIGSAAQPLPGATGTLTYLDGDPQAWGDSMFINKQRPDWVFSGAGFATSLPSYYSESAAFGFFGAIFKYLPGEGFEPGEGLHYLLEFELQTSPDAAGEFELKFIQESPPGFPLPLGALMQPSGPEYGISVWQNLTILVGMPPQCLESPDCADADGDGIRDDGCLWQTCVGGICGQIEIPFGDMGSANGACSPDGAADANDRFHALNCFSDQSTTGQSGYPCEANPPLALNVDAGGAFGDCAPDGVCDGNDAFHALNAFSGETTCSCPAGGPAPSGPDTVKGALVRSGTPLVDSAEIALVASRRTVRPSELLEVDVVLASPLADLRGYQLHLGTSGGKSGALELVDISIRQPSVFTTSSNGAGLIPMRAGLKPAPTKPTGPTAQADATAPTSAATAPTSPIAPAAPTGPTAAWSAFNIATQQMLAGLDGPGVAAPEDAYLATFTYRASADAAGTFTVELLHDSSDRSHRTFLFPTAANGGIDIRGEAFVSVHVAAGRDRK